MVGSDIEFMLEERTGEMEVVVRLILFDGPSQHQQQQPPDWAPTSRLTGSHVLNITDQSRIPPQLTCVSFETQNLLHVLFSF